MSRDDGFDGGDCVNAITLSGVGRKPSQVPSGEVAACNGAG
jgi:hypothetical protein